MNGWQGLMGNFDGLSGGIVLRNQSVNLQGLWSYTSFLVLAELASQPNGNDMAKAKTNEAVNPMARIWEKGQLSISESGGNGLEGSLMLGNGLITFSLVGRIMPVTDATPAIIEATARRQVNPDEMLIYELLGWILPDATGKSLRPTIRGSITQSRQNLDWSKPSQPVTDEVGAFVLTPLTMGISEVQWLDRGA